MASQDPPIGFYKWYAANPGAPREEKRNRAARYVRYVLLPLWKRAHPGRDQSPECRRYHKRALQQYYHCIDAYYYCIDADCELPPEPLYPLVRHEAPSLPTNIDGL